MRAKTSKPKALVYDERCPDCEYNGHLTNDGRPAKGFPRCGHCNNGRVTLYTWADIAKAKEPHKLLEKVDQGRARIVRQVELVDPYFVRPKKRP